MQRRTPVFIVTSSRPRVGKTLVARALTEYFCAQSRPVQAFDVNPDEFKLIDHLPAYTAAASINDTRGEMALFDQLVLGDEVPKVVDLGHLLFDRFFAVMQQIDFAAEARRRAVAPMVLFLADPDERARQGYAMLWDRFPESAAGAGVQRARARRSRAVAPTFPPTRLGGEPIDIPALTPVVRSVVDRRNFSFVAYAQKSNDRPSSCTSGCAACSSRSASSRCGSCSAGSRRNCGTRRKSPTHHTLAALTSFFERRRFTSMFDSMHAIHSV